MNWNCHWSLKVKLMKDADYPPFRSAAIHDGADERGQQCPGWCSKRKRARAQKGVVSGSSSIRTELHFPGNVPMIRPER